MGALVTLSQQPMRCRRTLSSLLAVTLAAAVLAGAASRARAQSVEEAEQAVGRAHGEVFGQVMPASTMIVVAGLLDDRWKVEIEAEAIVSEPA